MSSNLTLSSICHSKIIVSPFHEPVNTQELDDLLNIVKTSFGPKGKFKLIQNAAGGHTTMTLCSSRLFPALALKNILVQFIVSSINNHLSLYSDGGLFTASLILRLIQSMRTLTVPVTIIKQTCSYFADVFERSLLSNYCSFKISYNNITDMRLLVESTLNSKSACFSRDNIINFTIILLKVFVSCTPNPTNDMIFQRPVFNFVMEEGIPSKLELLSGLLMRVPELFKKKCLDHCLEALNSQNSLKIAMVSVSLAGDIDIPSVTIHAGADISVTNEILQYLSEFIKRLIGSHADIVLCQKVIHPLLKTQLELHDILAVDRLGIEVFNYFEIISGAVPISVLQEHQQIQLGEITSLELRHIGKHEYFICQNRRIPSHTLLVCDYNEEMLNDTKIVCHQALDALYHLLKEPKICYGAGCAEACAAYIVNKTIKEQVSDIAKSNSCSENTVLILLNHFVGVLYDVAISIHQGHRLSYVTDTVFHHLWEMTGNDYPSGKTTCKCGLYKADIIANSQWRLLENNLTNISDDEPIEHPEPSYGDKPRVVDLLCSKLNAFKVAYETAMSLIQTGICIISET